ncbi:MAG: hypothetical protein R6V21_03055 [Pelovirga sp.]
MLRFRVMSYDLNHERSRSGELCAELCGRIIREQGVDLVLLQRLGPPLGEASLQRLAERVGLAAYGPDNEGSCAYLSRYPLHNLQTIPLGHDDVCVRADFDNASERVHLLNLTLNWHPGKRLKQVARLFGDELLGGRSFPCATIIAGDFGLPLWGCGQVAFNPQIERAKHPLWRANYPATFPLWGRERIYFQGPVTAISGLVVTSKEAKSTLIQLPLVVDVETCDTRKTLRIKEQVTLNPKHPKPVCG